MKRNTTFSSISLVFHLLIRICHFSDSKLPFSPQYLRDSKGDLHLELYRRVAHVSVSLISFPPLPQMQSTFNVSHISASNSPLFGLQKGTCWTHKHMLSQLPIANYPCSRNDSCRGDSSDARHRLVINWLFIEGVGGRGGSL